MSSPVDSVATDDTPQCFRALFAGPLLLRYLFVVFLLLLAEVVLLQWIGGAYRNGFGAHEDEAAHFVSSVMTREYLGQLGSVWPMEFAQAYYLHLPKVAIGNWPPLLYLVAGIWFLLFGPSRVAALLLIAIFTAATATAIHALARSRLSPLAGWCCATLYVTLPLVQESSAAMMTESLVTLLLLLSSWQFARFAASPSFGTALSFGGLSTLAILTRGSGWALMFVPPITILLTRNWSLLRNWRLWVGALPVLLFCVPWYLYARGMSYGAMQGIDPSAPWAFFLTALATFPVFVFQSTGVALCALFLVGMMHCLRLARSGYEWAVLWALLVGVVLLQAIVPASIEARFMVQLLPPFLLLAAAGLDSLTTWIRRPSPTRGRWSMPAMGWTAVVLLTVTTTVRLPLHLRNGGYEAVTAQLLRTVDARHEAAVLLASDPIGEGSVIAEVAALQPPSDPVFLRGSRIIVSQDWLGRNYRERFPTPDSLRALLNDIPVDAVLVDAAAAPSPYHARLLAQLRADSATWTLAASLRVIRRGKARQEPVLVYRRRTPDTTRATDLALVAKLLQRAPSDALEQP